MRKKSENMLKIFKELTPLDLHCIRVALKNNGPGERNNDEIMLTNILVVLRALKAWHSWQPLTSEAETIAKIEAYLSRARTENEPAEDSPTPK